MLSDLQTGGDGNYETRYKCAKQRAYILDLANEYNGITETEVSFEDKMLNDYGNIKRLEILDTSLRVSEEIQQTSGDIIDLTNWSSPGISFLDDFIPQTLIDPDRDFVNGYLINGHFKGFCTHRDSERRRE